AAANLTGFLLGMTQQAYAEGRRDAAEDFLETATAIGRRLTLQAQAGLVERVQLANDELRRLKAAENAADLLEKTVARNPNNAAANGDLGEALALAGDWARAPSYLAKHQDEDWRTVGRSELAGPVLVQDRLALADLLWQLAGREAKFRVPLQRRAAL